MFDLDADCKSKIMELHIECLNENCPWTGELQNVEERNVFFNVT